MTPTRRHRSADRSFTTDFFFFFSYQNTINPSTTTSIDTVPTRGRACRETSPVWLRSRIRLRDCLTERHNHAGTIDSVHKRFFAYWPAARILGTGATPVTLSTMGARDLKTPIYDGRVDYHFTPKQRAHRPPGHVYLLTNDHTRRDPTTSLLTTARSVAVSRASQQSTRSLTDRWTLNSSHNLQ